MEYIEDIESSFRDKVCSAVELRREGANRYRVVNPYIYGDGDYLSIVLRRQDGQWLLSDEATTYMHLSYKLDDRALEAETRRRVIGNALSFFGVDDDDGELRINILDDRYGDALFSLVQAMLRISDVTFLSRERVQTTFRQDLREYLSQITDSAERTFDWAHPEHDPERLYTADCHMNGSRKRPVVIYGLVGDAGVRDVTIALQRFEVWAYKVYSVGVFEHFDEISKKPLMRLLDVLDKSFTSLHENKERIVEKLEESRG